MAINSIEVTQNIDELKKLLNRATTQIEELDKTLDEIETFKVFVHLQKASNSTSIKSLADEIGEKLLEVKPSPVVEPKSDEPIT